MARKVKCYITGEMGTSDTFVKIGTHYYKNQDVYDEDRRQKEERKQLIDYVCRTFLHYSDGQPFPPLLPKKLSELSFYDTAVILETFRTCEKDITYWLERKDFDSEYGKIAYMFSIVRSKIADVNKAYKKRERETNREKSVEDIMDFDNPNLLSQSSKKTDSLLNFLEGDEI